MNFIVNFLGLLFYIPYKLAKKFEEKRFKRFLLAGLSVDPSSKVEEMAKVRNYQGDKSRIRVGAKSIIMCELLVFRHGGNITIGDHCFIGEGTRIWSAKNISIGNRVLIAHDVNIHDQISHPLDSKERHEDFKKIFESGLQIDAKYNEEEVVIEDDVWIGFNATILKGVKIGKGAIIGAETIVTSDIPPYAVVVGNPMRIIKQTT